MSKKSATSREVIGVLGDYRQLLADIKLRIQAAQLRATIAANEGLLQLYWEVGGIIADRQKERGWGAAVLPRLSEDIRQTLSGTKGFSVRNMQLMAQFRNEYPDLFAIAQSPIAQLDGRAGENAIAQVPLAQLEPSTSGPPITQVVVAKLPWAHNITLIQKVKDRNVRMWYGKQAIDQGWSLNVLTQQIATGLHVRHGGAVTNFASTLPPDQSDLAIQLLKDPYIFDFLTLEPEFRERDLESGLLKHLQRFLIELGAGFAFVGKQVRLEVGGEDFYVDLLFYHLRLRCFVVVDLKAGGFKPEHAGKMNFYLSAIDESIRHASDAPSIGLILCQQKNQVIAEYSLRGIDQAIGVSAYELTRTLPPDLQSAMPTIEELESELSRHR